MKRIAIAETPPNATNYELDDGRIFRIYLRVVTPEADIPTAASLAVETVGYEIGKNGGFVVDDVTGEPVILPRNITQVPLENVRNGTDNMNGGWVATDLAYDPENPREDVKDVRQLAKLPKTGEEGDRIYAKDEKLTYVYSPGMYENIRQRRIGEAVALSPVVVPVDVSEIMPK